MKRFLGAALIGLLNIGDCFAANPVDIANDNMRAVVFLKKVNEKGEEIMWGTGMIVSHEGHIITVDHLTPDKNQKLIATIGQRFGTQYPLEFRESDKARDLALWQLPQSSSCRHSVVISDKPLDEKQNFVAVGFPGSEGYSREKVSIQNAHTAIGFYRSDGALEPGYSGGPVFDENGAVIGIVEGGAIYGARNNDIIPIAAAVDLIKKLGVFAAFGAQTPFPDNCYAMCRAPTHGVEAWRIEQSWEAQSGQVDGGHNEQDMCSGMIAAKLAISPAGSRIDLEPGVNQPGGGMWEDKNKDIFGHVTYVYHCKGKFRSQPIYTEKRSSACGLWE